MPSSPHAGYRVLPQSQIPLRSGSTEEVDELQVLAETTVPVEVTAWQVKWAFFILGAALLLPWNVMITATPFFLSRLENSSLQAPFGSYLTSCLTAANLGFLAHATLTSKQSSPSQQIYRVLAIQSFLNLLLSMSTLITTTPALFFAFVLLNGSAQTALGSYLQTAMITIASRFGSRAIQSLMAGQAAVAVVVSAVQLVSALSSTVGDPRHLSAERTAEEKSALAFFSLTAISLMFTILVQRWLAAQPSYKALITPLEEERRVERNSRLANNSQTKNDIAQDSAHFLRVAKVNLVYEIAVAYVFIVTLAVFPAITISIQPTHPGIHPLVFSATHFLVFAAGDLLGRQLCSFSQLVIWSARKLLILSCSRTLFIPLFLMCNIHRSGANLSTPIINSDFLFMLILLLLGTSNGYVSSLCMMAAPSLATNERLGQEDADVAATLASFSLVSGLTMGSIGSFAVRAAICGCNPFT